MKSLLKVEKRSVFNNILHLISISILSILLVFMLSRNEAHFANQELILESQKALIINGQNFNQLLEDHIKNDSIQIGSIMVSIKDIEECQTKSNK